MPAWLDQLQYKVDYAENPMCCTNPDISYCCQCGEPMFRDAEECDICKEKEGCHLTCNLPGLTKKNITEIISE